MVAPLKYSRPCCRTATGLCGKVVVIPNTEILGAGRGRARRAPPGSSFPTDMGCRQMLSLEACLQLLFLAKMPIKKMLCTFLLR